MPARSAPHRSVVPPYPPNDQKGHGAQASIMPAVPVAEMALVGSSANIQMPASHGAGAAGNHGRSHQARSQVISDTPPKRFECPQCSRKFERRGHLQEHIDSVHNQLKPHICSICGQTFAHASSRRRHMRRAHGREQ